MTENTVTSKDAERQAMEQKGNLYQVQRQIDVCQCKAEVLGETFDALEKKARDGEFSLKSSFWAGVTFIVKDIASELNDIANELI